MTAPAPAAGPPATTARLGVVRLARLLVRARLRHAWNLLRARPTGAAGLLLLLGLASSVAYVMLFSAALEVIGRRAGLEGQATALGLMAAAIALASLGSKAAAGDAVLAGTPENEFFLARPVSLATLVGARALAAIVTDPFGVLFLLPVLIAALVTWELPPGALPVAVITSVAAQVAVAALAQTIQLAVVRWVPRRHRSSAWMVLRLLSVGTMATVWMAATSILRVPGRFVDGLPTWERVYASTPAAALGAPLVAFRLGGLTAAVLALVPVLLGAVAACALAVAVARWAGMYGWEEAGAPWADRNPTARAAAVLTPARREWRQLVRDRARLAAFLALPALLVGVQIFGAIGWTWQTATLGRVAVLVFSVTLYMAALGPLGHMQSERHAFWILRTVPVSLGRLMAAKARAWALILGAVAALAFGLLASAVPGVRLTEVAFTGALVVGGVMAMTALAVAFGALVADLSSDGRPALGPGTVYFFLTVGGLFNVVLEARGLRLVGALLLYGTVIAVCWRAGMANLRVCLDADAVARRRPRLADVAPWALIALLGPPAMGQGLTRLGAPLDVIAVGQLAVFVLPLVVALGGVALRFFRSRRRSASRAQAT